MWIKLLFIIQHISYKLRSMSRVAKFFCSSILRFNSIVQHCCLGFIHRERGSNRNLGDEGKLFRDTCTCPNLSSCCPILKSKQFSITPFLYVYYQFIYICILVFFNHGVPRSKIMASGRGSFTHFFNKEQGFIK
jgi:hypothetical protein